MDRVRDVIIVGGGLAGLSAAIYLARAKRDVLVIDAGHSMAVWEPEVQNYLGFPEGISGEALLERGREQARMFGAAFVEDEVLDVDGRKGSFVLKCRGENHGALRLLLATGIHHIPPDIPGVPRCLGRSMFFCKDCDGYRVQGKRVAIIGNHNEAVEYALQMLVYSPKVMIVTNGDEPMWDEQHDIWVDEYEIPVFEGRVKAIDHEEGMIQALRFEGGRTVALDCLFTTRGDVFHMQLARCLGARIDQEGQIVVGPAGETSVPGVYAAGCVTPANCQMIVAAGQGATAAQGINRDLFEESLKTHSLLRYREVQIERGEVFPEILE